MASKKTTTSKWSYKAELIAACVCDWGCPCNFNATPTKGYCEGLYAADITTGVHGETRLNGIKYAWAASWPGAIHEGEGTGKIWIGDNATKEQVAALEGILRGKYGGTPWGILGGTIDSWLETSLALFEWYFDGPRSRFKVGSEVQASLDSMRNPVTGAEATAKVVLPAGIVAKELDLTATKTFSVFTKGLKFAAPGKYSFYATVEHGN